MGLVPGPFRLFSAEPTEGIQMPLGIMFNYREATEAAARGEWPPVAAVDFWEQVFKGFAKQAEFEGGAVAAYVAALITNARAVGKGVGHVSSPESAAPHAPKLEENFHVLYHGAMRSNGFLKTPAAAAAVDSGGATVVIDPRHWLLGRAAPTAPAAAASSGQQTAASAAGTGPAGQAASRVPTSSPRREEGVGHVSSPSPALGEAEVIEEC